MTSFDAHAYMDATAAALALPIPRERRDAVAANLTRLHVLAQEVLAWQPPPESTCEASGVPSLAPADRGLR